MDHCAGISFVPNLVALIGHAPGSVTGRQFAGGLVDWPDRQSRRVHHPGLGDGSHLCDDLCRGEPAAQHNQFIWLTW